MPTSKLKVTRLRLETTKCHNFGETVGFESFKSCETRLLRRRIPTTCPLPAWFEALATCLQLQTQQLILRMSKPHLAIAFARRPCNSWIRGIKRLNQTVHPPLGRNICGVSLLFQVADRKVSSRLPYDSIAIEPGIMPFLEYLRSSAHLSNFV